MRRYFQKTSPRRPLIVAGHCRRPLVLLLLRRSGCCCDGASLPKVLLRRVPPRCAAGSTSRTDAIMRRPFECHVALVLLRRSCCSCDGVAAATESLLRRSYAAASTTRSLCASRPRDATRRMTRPACSFPHVDLKFKGSWPTEPRSYYATPLPRNIS